MQKNKPIYQSFELDEKNLKNLDLLIRKLKLSLESQKIFLKEIDNKLSIYCNNDKEDNLQNTNEVSLIEQLIIVLPYIIIQLGIPFTYLFLNEDDTTDNLINLFYKKNDEKISHIFEACLEVFNFSLYYDYINRLKHFLIEKGIIENKEENINSSINAEQYLFEMIISWLNDWSELKNIGKDIENISKLINEYNNILNEIKNLSTKMRVTQAQNEFYHELIKPFGDYLENIKMNSLKEENYIDSEEYNEEQDQEEEEDDFNKQIESILNIPLYNRKYFFLNEKIREKPNQVNEFKNYTLPLNQESTEELKMQFCSFLNSEGGRLYMGINEQNIVKGIILDYKKRDVLRNFLVNLTYDFYPKCRLDKILVYFIPIKDINTLNFIQKKYIIKIRIHPGDPHVLYSMFSKGYHSTIRRNGICYELNSTEISDEIIKRDEKKYINNNSNSKLLFNENDIKDPEPEVNPQDLEENDSDNMYDYGFNNLNNGKKIIKDYGGRPQRRSYGRPNKNIKNNLRPGVITIKVTNIDEKIQLNDINRFFSGCKCSSQKFFPNGYGYLNFYKINDANNCLIKYDGAKLGNKKIRLNFVNND